MTRISFRTPEPERRLAALESAPQLARVRVQLAFLRAMEPFLDE